MTALFAAVLMVPLLNRWALERKMLDEPEERKVHTQAVPRLGGIAVCMAFLFSLLVFVDMGREVRGIVAGALVIFFTGLVDDLHGLSPRRKFFGEIGAVVTTMVVGHISIASLGNLLGTGELLLPLWLSLPFTVVAVVGVVNAFNLIDGLDGLAGGTSVIALITLGILAWQVDNVEVLVLAAALLGALLGFLKYNFFPARIFMGDAGSLVVGFVVAFLAIILTQRQGSHIQPVVPLLVVGLPVADTLWVMGRRLLAGQSPFAADRWHMHHKFLALGFEHRYTVIVMYTISLFWGAVVLGFHQQPAWLLLSAYLLISLFIYLGLRFLRSRPRLLSFLGSDSSEGLRESVTYRIVAERVALLATLMEVMLFAYLTLAVIASSAAGDNLLMPMVVLLAACSGLIVYTRNSGNQFVLAMYYGAGMIITYVVTRYGPMDVLRGLPLNHLGDSILLGMGVLALFRFIFRRGGEFYLASLDYLLVGVTLFLFIVTPELSGIFNVKGVLVRGIILFISLKVIALQGYAPLRRAGFAILGVLLVMALRVGMD
jgi:UDP-GlcNAc:undecaprenyl-phosphate GlcNAc-1-phosphate transferase